MRDGEINRLFLKKKKREIQNAGELKRERTDNQTSFEKRVKRRVNWKERKILIGKKQARDKETWKCVQRKIYKIHLKNEIFNLTRVE